MSGSVICGDMPEDGIEIWKDNYIHVNIEMTDEEIKKIILEALEDKKKLNELSENSLELMKSCYLSSYANDLYSNIINDITFN